MIHAGNSEMNVSGFLPADRVVQTPLIYNENYIPFLLKYCEKHGIDALIPLFDIDLPKLSKYRKEFDKIGVNVIVSAPDVIEICSNKWRLYHFLKEHGFYTKKTFINLENFKKSVDGKETGFPVIIKPRCGMGSIGIDYVTNMEDLNAGYQFTSKRISETYLKYEQEVNEEAVLIQEKCVGEEYNLDVINDLDNNYQATIVKRKVRMRCGETDCAVTVQNKELEKLGEAISQTLNHTGNLDVDLIMENNKPYIIDMNARFGGGYPFSHLAGVNLPKAIIKWIRGELIKEDLFRAEYGVKGLKDIVIKKI